MVCLKKDVRRRLKNLCWFFAMLIAFGSLANSARSQETGFKDLFAGQLAPPSSEKATFTATLAPSNAQPGDEVTLSVTAKLPPQSYIYATTGEFEQRTQIRITNLIGLEQIDADFQPDRAPETKLDPVL